MSEYKFAMFEMVRINEQASDHHRHLIGMTGRISSRYSASLDINDVSRYAFTYIVKYAESERDFFDEHELDAVTEAHQ